MNARELLELFNDSSLESSSLESSSLESPSSDDNMEDLIDYDSDDEESSDEDSIDDDEDLTDEENEGVIKFLIEHEFIKWKNATLRHRISYRDSNWDFWNTPWGINIF